MRTAAGALRERLTLPSLNSLQFRLLFASGFLSTSAHRGMFLARGWLVRELTDSVLAVGAVTMAAWLPAVFIGPFAGVAADRIDRRCLLIAAMVFAAASALVLAAIEFAGYTNLWYVLLPAFAAGSAQSIGQPARASLVANSVPREDLLNAVSLTSLGAFGSRIVGPLLGLPLLVTVGAGASFLAGGMLLMVGLAVLLRVSSQRVAGVTAFGWRSAGDDLRDAVRYVRADRQLAAVMLLVTLHCGLTMAFDSDDADTRDHRGWREHALQLHHHRHRCGLSDRHSRSLDHPKLHCAGHGLHGRRGRQRAVDGAPRLRDDTARGDPGGGRNRRDAGHVHGAHHDHHPADGQR